MRLRLPFTLAFVAFALALLLGPLRPYLVETAALTPFYADASVGGLMVSPGGVLLFVASGLQSCFAIPWLGASLFVTLLVTIAYLLRWVFRVSDSWFGLCWVPSFALLLNYTRMGYLIYTTKATAPATAPLLYTIVLLAFLCFVIWLVRKWKGLWKTRAKAGKPAIVGLLISAVCFIVSGVVAYQKSFRDQNFLNTLRMKHSAEEGCWEQVLQIAKDGEEEPTRAQVCLTRLALFKTGRMGDELFAYPDGSAAYNAPKQNQWLRLMIGPLLYYHYGKTGFAYRWAMEDLVEYGERPAYLRYMHSVARLNGEEALAKRYERVLARTLFYKDVCVREDEEAKSIRPLLKYTDQLDGDDGLVEFYLLNSFALSEGGSREMVELSLMNGLITKTLTGFWPRFLALLPTWNGHIPTHYQEAALMVAQLQGGSPISEIPIDPTIGQRFQRLVEASARMGDNAANAIALRPEFGDTYWYYYFFVEGLKTN